MKNKKIKDMVILSMFIAIELLVAHVPFLGFVPVGPLRATTLHIPVILAGILLGKKQGAFIGAVFGLNSLIVNTINPTVTSFVFSPFISGNILSLFVALVPRILIGYLSGLIYEKLHNDIGIIVGSLVGALTNTILVMSSIYFIFGEQYATSIGKSFSDLLPYVTTIIFTQGTLEAVVGAIIVYMASKVLIKQIKTY